MKLTLHAWCIFTVVFIPVSGRGDGYCSSAYECTDGFMSLDRIDAVLDKYMYGSFEYTSNGFQAIFPGVNFTCNGSIQTWILGVAMDGTATSSLPELQIWRSNGNGLYSKVGNTPINVTEENATQLYHYPLSSPLPFQAGDILGYYQPEITQSQLRLYAEKDGQGRQLGYYISSASAYSELSPSTYTESGDDRFQSSINVQTDSPGCECGFMSVEQMRILLKLDTVNQKKSYPQRQQITPQMRFTCDGWITKWIIGAGMASGSVYPELQVWRNISNTYQKISGTSIVIPDMSGIQTYEISNFDPIAIQAGDILGVFLPPATSSRLTLLSEDTTSPTNYYLTANSTDSESPYDMIDLDNTPSLMLQDYHLLVSAEIVLTSPIQASMSHTSIMTMATPLQLHSISPTNHNSSPTPYKPNPFDGDDDRDSSQTFVVVVGVSTGVAAAIGLLAALLVIAAVCVLRQKKHKGVVDLQQHSSYLSSRRDSPVYYSVLEASHPQNHKEDSEGHHYDIIREDTQVYDQAYAVVSLDRVARPAPMKKSDEDIYRKFTNPLYAETKI